MSTSELEKLIVQGERIREEKKWDEALAIFDQAITQAAAANNSEVLVQILGHKLIVYKHLFYESENPLFLELFRGEVETGFNIIEHQKLSGKPKALMLLRMGDYFLLRQEYTKAVGYYHESLSNFEQQQSGEYGEYLGHLGLGQALAGQRNWLVTLNQAHEYVSKDQKLRDFHKLIILSGIKLREAHGYAFTGNKDSARKALAESEQLAKQVKKEHGLPLRLEEAERLKKRFGL